MDEIARRPTNYKKKVSPDFLVESEEGLNNIKNAIEIARVIVDNLKDNVGWEALKKTYEEKIEYIEKDLDGFKDLTDKQRDYLLSDRKFSREFKDTVENLEKQIEFLTERYNESKALLDEKKSRVKSAPSGQGF